MSRGAVLLGLALALSASAVAAPSPATALGPESGLDGRAWELVSPPDKNGGGVEAPGGAAAGVLQAAAGGGAIAFGSAASFGNGAGAAPVSQYVASRGPLGWSTENVTPPLLSGTYAGGAYQLFSADLATQLLSSGWQCRDGAASCAAANPPLGFGAPVGYRNLYLRQGGSYYALIGEANVPALAPADFELSLAGASPGLGHAVISTCAALTADAVEVPAAEGCDPLSPNLYLSSAGSLAAINLLPGHAETAPGAALAAPAGAISVDGSRVYWSALAGGDLYLREGAATVQVDAAAGGGGTFQAAAADGSLAYFTKAGHLYRFDAVGGGAIDLTPGGGVQGVLGASADGSHVYFLDGSGLQLWRAGTTLKVAAAADPSNFPPATGTARVTPDGSRLAFVSSASLTGYANVGKTEVFVYDASAGKLLCASCNPKGSTPAGPSSIPGARAAGEGGPAAYKPNALSADGKRLFFDSADALVVQDTNKAPDVYEWQAQGSGGCLKASGCIGLVSSGRTSSASFADASADGTDAFFLTAASLLPADTGAVDLYDARAGGGFPEAALTLPCVGDDCQGPAPGPEDQSPGTAVFQGPANPPLHYKGKRKRAAKKKHGKHRKRAKERSHGKRGGRR